MSSEIKLDPIFKLRLEINHSINHSYAEVEKIDKNAFVAMNSIKDTKGGMAKKSLLHG